MDNPCDYSNFGAPFDDSDADIIIRSSPSTSPSPGDRPSATHFRVHQLFLIKASPEFKRLLCEAIPSQYPNQDEEPGITRDTYDDLPVLCLSEDRETLHSLLTAIYPTNVAYPRTLDAMMKTHAAAKKYGMSSALTLFRAYTGAAPVVTTENAFLAFFLAFNRGLKEEALEAARICLTLPLTFEALGEELCNASGPALKALWRHRKAASRAIAEGVMAYKIEVGDLRGWSSPHDRRGRCAELGLGPRDRLSFFAVEIIRDISLMNIASFTEIMSSQGFHCPSCGARIRLDFQGLFRCLERHVDDSIKQALASPAFLDS